MQISTKGRYGLEALLALCLESDGGHVSLKRIAERCNISENYILQIFLVLRRAGIVESVRGAQGGYCLGRDPSQITAGDVLDALEGPMAVVSCLEKGCKSPCSRQEACATRILWGKIMDSLTQLTRSITLADLAEYYRSVNNIQSGWDDYCI